MSLVKLKTPVIGQQYRSKETGEVMTLVEEGICRPKNYTGDNPLGIIAYYAFKDKNGKKWYDRQTCFWIDFEEVE